MVKHLVSVIRTGRSQYHNTTFSCSKISEGRAIAQAVSRRLPTAAAQIRVRFRSCRICGGQSGTGAGFLRVLRFPMPIRTPPIALQLLSYVIRGWYNRPNSGRSAKWTQSHPMRKINIKTISECAYSMYTILGLIFFPSFHHVGHSLLKFFF
jgi:hypothetical protein